MTRHLTYEEVSLCLIGDAAPDGTLHAEDCAACRAELAGLEASLAAFRESVHSWSEQMSNENEIQLVHLLTPAPLDRPWRAGFSSLMIHAGMIALVLFLGTLKPVEILIREQVTPLFAPLKPYVAAHKKDQTQGGGGGGMQNTLDASRGKLPKVAPREFVPPRVDPPENPKLPMMPTIVAPLDVPNITAMNYGDPLSKLGVPSNGSGLKGGIGNGLGGGVGSGKGPGAGPGRDGGFGGGAYRIGGGVSAPTVLSKVEPEYSEEARKAKWQGTVVLQLVVDASGRPQSVRVVRSLGLGLDQKAMEAVEKWTFKPGMKDGRAVPVIATIEVNFRLL